MTLKEEINTLRLIAEIQQVALRHYANYIKAPEDEQAEQSLAMGSANANNARKMYELLNIPPVDGRMSQ